MDYLVDTSILLRLVNSRDVQHGIAQNAVVTLELQGHRLFTTPQILVEFRNAATRPTVNNGLGLTTTSVEQFTADFEIDYTLLPEIPGIYPAWKALVQAAGVIGKQVHDARLAAICQVYSIAHMLTFNVQHFARLAVFCPGLAVVDPRSV